VPWAPRPAVAPSPHLAGQRCPALAASSGPAELPLGTGPPLRLLLASLVTRRHDPLADLLPSWQTSPRPLTLAHCPLPQSWEPPPPPGVPGLMASWRCQAASPPAAGLRTHRLLLGQGMARESTHLSCPVRGVWRIEPWPPAFHGRQAGGRRPGCGPWQAPRCRGGHSARARPSHALPSLRPRPAAPACPDPQHPWTIRSLMKPQANRCLFPTAPTSGPLTGIYYSVSSILPRSAGGEGAQVKTHV
jgi:hypothetical protein